MKLKKRGMLCLVLTTVLLMGATINSSAASMTRTLNWAGYVVTATNSWSNVNEYANKHILTVYNGSNGTGLLLDAKTPNETYSVCKSVITNSAVKSAFVKFKAMDGAIVAKQYTYTKNKGENVSYK